MNILCIQFNSIWQDSEKNIAQLQILLEQHLANRDDIDLVVLPETFHAGFSMQPSLFAENLEGDISNAIATLAKHYSVNIIAGVAQQQPCLDLHIETENIHAEDIQTTSTQAMIPQAFQFYNRCLLFNRQGDLVASYSKHKLFSYAGEHKVFKAGSAPTTVEIDGEPFALLICYDLRFPELFRAVAKQVKGFIVIANWPDSRQVHWQTLLQARAIENQTYVIGINRVGIDGVNVPYSGSSMILDPKGKRLAFETEKEAILEASLDPEPMNAYREKFPIWKDADVFELYM